jgi:hypothetical protein
MFIVGINVCFVPEADIEVLCIAQSMVTQRSYGIEITRVPERPMAMTRLGRQRTAGRLSAPEVPALSVERQLSGSKSPSVGL